MKAFPLLILLLIPLISVGQTYSTEISDSSILAFMKWELINGKKYSEDSKFRTRKKTSINISRYDTLNFIQNDSLSNYSWQNDEYLRNRRYKIDSILTISEMAYLFKQYTSLIDTNWSHKIQGSSIKKKNNGKDIYYYAVPLFTTDEKYVILKKSFYCGNVCAYGGIYLYQKVGLNDWKLIKIFNGWIS